MAAELTEIPIEDLTPHPDNPRVAMREDVVEAIVANLDGEYPQQHAIHVRPLADHYQIVAGHHRAEAARRKGLSGVWAWVEEMSDDDAHMMLATSNSQGELSPLEYGIHALQAVPKGKHGSGLRAYADRLGKTEQYIGQLRHAAEVLSSAKTKLEFSSLLDKAKHLSAIHKLPESCWQAAVEWLADSDAPVVEVVERVAKAADFHAEWEPGGWSEYLPVDECTAAVFGGTSPSAFARLLDVAERVAADLASVPEDYDGDHEDLVDTWREYLVAGTCGESWGIKAVQEKRSELEDIKWRRERQAAPALPYSIECADAVEWLADMDPDSADLLLTDPPYSTELDEGIRLGGETIDDITHFVENWLQLAISRLKPTGRAYVFVGAYPDELAAYLLEAYRFAWQLGWAVDPPLVWTYRNVLGPSPTHKYKLNWQAVIHLRGPDARPLDCPEMVEQFTVHDVAAPDGRHDGRMHKWEKPVELASRFVRHATQPGELVIDPFCGTGALVLGAVNVGRRCMACDRDPEMLELAKQRGLEVADAK